MTAMIQEQSRVTESATSCRRSAGTGSSAGGKPKTESRMFIYSSICKLSSASPIWSCDSKHSALLQCTSSDRQILKRAGKCIGISLKIALATFLACRRVRYATSPTLSANLAIHIFIHLLKERWVLCSHINLYCEYQTIFLQLLLSRLCIRRKYLISWQL